MRRRPTSPPRNKPTPLLPSSLLPASPNAAGLTLAILLCLWHVCYAWWFLSRGDFWTFVGSRAVHPPPPPPLFSLHPPKAPLRPLPLIRSSAAERSSCLPTTSSQAIAAFFAALFATGAAESHLVHPPFPILSFHLHHYVIAWYAATFARFNHWLSAAALAVAAGVFVQGAGAWRGLAGPPVLSPFVMRCVAETSRRLRNGAHCDGSPPRLQAPTGWILRSSGGTRAAASSSRAPPANPPPPAGIPATLERTPG